MAGVTVQQIATFLEGSCRVSVLSPGAMAVAVTGARPVSEAGSGHVTYVKRPDERGAAQLASVAASVVIVPGALEVDLDLLRGRGVALVAFSDRPRLHFIQLLERFFAPERSPGIAPSAAVAEGAVLGHDVCVGHGASLGAVRIGDRTVIGAGVHLYDNVVVGADCLILAGAVIGSDGFGYERDENGAPIKFPHIGGVRIGDQVEIGANTVIDRGTLSDTVIAHRAKIDNVCHIGHNVEVGEDTMIVAGAMIGGSTKIGKRVWIGPQVAVSNGLVIGDDAYVTMGSVVVQNVAAGERMTGNWAVAHMRFLAHMRKIG